ncbi:hypothetical protein PMIN01_02205 [Paraphaeosphaeria minitans]|uniref:Uncharacterized protein n=1 Tax=Paraphaeosphaeria minitans TaxID=565426 RepID=A0A9P6KV13_9PLEO|nr:hypothetical protein PMIN01_02205 [Paraphaeosphaeria minitans]
MSKLRKPNPSQPPLDSESEMPLKDSTQQSILNNDSSTHGQPHLGQSTSFTEPEGRLEPLRSHPPRSPTPYPTAQGGEEDRVASSEDATKSEGSDKKGPMQFPRDFNPDMFTGLCWCCGGRLVCKGLGEECVECWADQIVY